MSVVWGEKKEPIPFGREMESYGEKKKRKQFMTAICLSVCGFAAARYVL